MKLSTPFMILVALTPAVLAGQSQQVPDLSGTWRTDTPDGPQTIVVRPDSSASWGDETVRWRIVADSIFIAMGDEWLVYNYALSGKKLTLSGGDLVDSIELERAGPPSPRPDGVPVPPAPAMDRRADVGT